MDYRDYFKKNGCIYGVSQKPGSGPLAGYVKKFTNLAEAEKWLETCEYDFRERELCSKTKAMQYLRLGYRLDEYREWSFEKHGKNSNISKIKL